jgi:hypothetical protein
MKLLLFLFPLFCFLQADKFDGKLNDISMKSVIVECEFRLFFDCDTISVNISDSTKWKIHDTIFKTKKHVVIVSFEQSHGHLLEGKKLSSILNLNSMKIKDQKLDLGFDINYGDGHIDGSFILSKVGKEWEVENDSYIRVQK